MVLEVQRDVGRRPQVFVGGAEEALGRPLLLLKVLVVQLLLLLLLPWKSRYVAVVSAVVVPVAMVIGAMRRWRRRLLLSHFSLFL